MLSKKLLSTCQETGTPVDRYYNISWGKTLNFNARAAIDSSSTGVEDVHPINSYWGRFLIAFTYTAAELSGCGLVSGAVIKKLRYFANEINSTNIYPWPNYAIAMCHIPSATKSSDPVTSNSRTNFTTVKSQHNFTPPGATSSAQESYNKFIEFTLDTNFTWNGTDGIGFIFATGTRPNVSDYSAFGVGEMVADGQTYFARDDAAGTYTVNDTSYTSTSIYAGRTGQVGSRPIVQMYATQNDTAGNYGNVPLFFNDLYTGILHGFNGGTANVDTLSSNSNDSTATSSQFNADDNIRIGFEVTPYRQSSSTTHNNTSNMGETGLRSDMARHVPIQSTTNNSTNAYWETGSGRNNPTLESDGNPFQDYEDDFIVFNSTDEAVSTVDAAGTNLTNITDGSMVFLYKTTDTAFLFLNEGPNNSYQGFIGAYSSSNGFYNSTSNMVDSILLNNSTITSLYASARSGNWSMLEFRGVDFSSFSSSANIGINDYYGPLFRSSNFDLRAMLIFKNKLDNTKAAELKTYFENNSGVY